MAICHVSRSKRNGKRGLVLSGVEKFAMYLDRALGGNLVIYEYADFPGWVDHEAEPDYEQAALLNGWLLREKIIKPGDTVVCDGYWGIGLEKCKDIRLISVCHGSYIGTLMQLEKYPWQGEPNLGLQMKNQSAFWHDSGCEIVAVSKQAAYEIDLLDNLDSTVIDNGVDLTVFHPRPGLKKPGLVLHAATGNRKGADIIDHIYQLLNHDLVILDKLNAADGNLTHEAERWCQATVALFPTRYEGGSYARLEAAACGVPILTYATGEAVDFDERVGIVLDDLHPVPFAEALTWMIGGGALGYDPAGWAKEHADFEQFAVEWRDFLGIK